MIQVTSLELSQKLHEMFPSWGPAHMVYSPTGVLLYPFEPTVESWLLATPAFDLAYLLEKSKCIKVKNTDSTRWNWKTMKIGVNIGYSVDGKFWYAEIDPAGEMEKVVFCTASNPTEAAGLLCLELGRHNLGLLK